ncbi:MAG: hypothetical protein QG653_714 [Patescibacteria group bacterium]|nr:hypothetical protein [Patescibacteria group bacterium]
MMKFSLKHYVRYLRKQKEHIQHVHAIIFAGSITACLAVVILYAQYDYWHATYTREDDVVIVEEETVAIASPVETLARLFSEGKVRFKEAVNSIEPLTGEGETFDRSVTESSK